MGRPQKLDEAIIHVLIQFEQWWRVCVDKKEFGGLRATAQQARTAAKERADARESLTGSILSARTLLAKHQEIEQ